VALFGEEQPAALRNEGGVRGRSAPGRSAPDEGFGEIVRKHEIGTGLEIGGEVGGVGGGEGEVRHASGGAVLVRIEEEMGERPEIVEVREVHRHARETGHLDLGVFRNARGAVAVFGRVAGDAADAMVEGASLFDVTHGIAGEIDRQGAEPGPQRGHLVEVAVWSSEEARHGCIALREAGISDEDLDLHRRQARGDSFQARRDDSGKLVPQRFRRGVTRDAVQFVEEEESALREVVLVVKAAVETLEPDDKWIVDRLRVGGVGVGDARSGEEEHDEEQPRGGTQPCPVDWHTQSGRGVTGRSARRPASPCDRRRGRGSGHG
jgi:hypothetical protein